MTPQTEAIVQRLRQAFPDIDFAPAPLLARGDTPGEQYYVRVAPERLLEVMRFLYDHPDLSFEQLCDLTCVDYLDFPDAADRYGVIYSLLSLTRPIATPATGW